MKRKKIIRIGAIVVIAVLIVLAIGRKKGWFGDSDLIKICTETAAKRTLVETVPANGRIQPEVEVKISPDVSGEIVELYIREGDEVKVGDVLAKVDPEIYISNYERIVAGLNTQKANLSNARARKSQAEAQFINATASYNRNKQLWEKKVISDSDFDAAKSSYEVAKAEVSASKESVSAAEFSVKSSEASVKEARENLTKTTIIAPTDGTIYNLNVEKGERVVGASQFSSGTELMRIANLNKMEVSVEVNENDIVRVALGDTSLIEVDAYLDRDFKGVVTEIANSANTTGLSADQVTNFDVKIRILQESYSDLVPDDNPNISPFRPGMSATVEIQTKTASLVLTVPIQAVTTRADSTGKVRKNSYADESDEDKNKEYLKEDKEEDDELSEYVFLYKDGAAILQKVKSGVQDNTYIEILEGLEDGQEVIVGPYRALTKKLKNNDQVTKVSKEDLFKE